jgi:hypothetical protein
LLVGDRGSFLGAGRLLRSTGFFGLVGFALNGGGGGFTFFFIIFLWLLLASLGGVARVLGRGDISLVLSGRLDSDWWHAGGWGVVGVLRHWDVVDDLGRLSGCGLVGRCSWG